MEYTNLGNTHWPLLLKLAREISLASGLSGKRNRPTWWSDRWMSSTGDILPKGKVR